MKKLNGKLNYNIAVLISGRGSNLKSIIKQSLKKDTIFNVKIVISNKQKANGLLIAKKNGIKNYFFDFTKSKIIGKVVLNLLKKNNIKLLCLAGFMRILPAYFIKSYNGKIINIHPSLLPKYKGLNTHERVILNNEKYTGCTVHYVNKFLDSGKIIFQRKVRITRKDTARSIEKKVLKLEHRVYPKAIKMVLSNL